MDNNLNYGVVGNCRTAALVSARGTIEWMCLPDFDSPSVFASLLDRRKGGCFGFDVAEEYRISQAYIPTRTSSPRPSRPPRASSSYSISCPATVRAGTNTTCLPNSTATSGGSGEGRRLRVHYSPLRPTSPRPHGSDRHTRIHRKPQPLRPEEPALSLRPRCRSERSHGGRRSSSNATNSSCCRTTKK